MKSATVRSMNSSRTDPLKSKRSKPKTPSPSASKSDILISIKPTHMDRIVNRSKNHEFRKYLIPAAVKRMWLYVSSPDQTLRYIAVISNGKKPGEIEKEDGLGNADFNAGLKKDVAAFAYEILELYQLKEPLSLKSMQDRFSVTFPQRYTYVLDSMLNEIVIEDQIRLF